MMVWVARIVAASSGWEEQHNSAQPQMPQPAPHTSCKNLARWRETIFPWQRQQGCATARPLISLTAIGCHSNVRLCNSGLC
jgi:hypothetical protein